MTTLYSIFYALATGGAVSLAGGPLWACVGFAALTFWTVMNSYISASR